MGKNRDRESLVRLIANTITHEIVIRHTNMPESRNFLKHEIIEYRSQEEKVKKQHTWNNDDKAYMREKITKKIKEKLKVKYPDINYKTEELNQMIDKEIKSLGPG